MAAGLLSPVTPGEDIMQRPGHAGPVGSLLEEIGRRPEGHDPLRVAIEYGALTPKRGGIMRYGPFTNAGIKTAEILDFVSAAKKYEAGDRSPEVIDEIGYYLGQQRNRQDQAWYDWGIEIAKEIPAFGIELMATGPAFTAGKKATLRVLGKVGEKWTGKMLANLAGLAAQGAINPQLVAHNAAARMGDEYQLGEDARGDLIFSFANEEDGFLDSIPEGFLSAMIQIGTEKLGEPIGDAAKAAGGWIAKTKGFQAFVDHIPLKTKIVGLKAGIARRAMEMGLTDSKALAVTTDIMRKAQWHGMPIEFIEERVADALEGAANLISPEGGFQPYEWPSWTQIMAEGLAFSLPGFGQMMVASGTAMGRKALGDTIEQMDAAPAGIDFHPLLPGDDMPESVAGLMGVASEEQAKLAERNSKNWLLAEHIYEHAPEVARAIADLENPSRKQVHKINENLVSEFPFKEDREALHRYLNARFEADALSQGIAEVEAEEQVAQELFGDPEEQTQASSEPTRPFDRVVGDFQQAFNLRDDETQAVGALIEARAAAEGMSPDQYVEERIDKVEGSLDVNVGGESATLIPPGSLFQFKAFHGTPHDVDRFSTSKIGTGEGAQAYGWGLYFAEEPEVAEDYRSALTDHRNEWLLDGKPITADEHYFLHSALGYLRGRTVDEAIEHLRETVESRRGKPDLAPEIYERALNEIEKHKDRLTPVKGSVYEVSVDANDNEVLQWEAALDMQSPIVNAAAKQIESDIHLSFQEELHDATNATVEELTGEELYRWLYRVANEDGLPRQYTHDNASRNVSEYLSDLGIKGIKYADQGSRGIKTTTFELYQENDKWVVEANDGSGPRRSGVWRTKSAAQEWIDSRILPKPTHNYVIFDDANIKITGKNGQSVDVQTLYQREPQNPQTQTPAFKRWFGDSKVVDEKGEPLVVYHGSIESFTEFKQMPGRENTGPQARVGFFFSPYAKTAEAYAGNRAGANTLSAFVSLKNPAYISFRVLPGDAKEASLLRSTLTDLGHDGIIVNANNMSGGIYAPHESIAANAMGRKQHVKLDASRGRPKIDLKSSEIVAFDSTQIKSATGNRGTFDPNDPSILHQGNRASIIFRDDGRAIIRALNSPDISSALHELGHLFRRDLSGADLAAAEEWAGVKDGTWDTAAEEKFARGFERYLADGRSPTEALRRVFAKLKQWLADIYRGIIGSDIDVDISPAMRGVFDRLFEAPQATAEGAPVSAKALAEGAPAPTTRRAKSAKKSTGKSAAKKKASKSPAKKTVAKKAVKKTTAKKSTAKKVAGKVAKKAPTKKAPPKKATDPLKSSPGKPQLGIAGAPEARYESPFGNDKVESKGAAAFKKSVEGGDDTVGMRSIVDFVNSLMTMPLLIGNTQLSKKTPGQYESESHLARQKAPGGAVSFHEAGHGLSAILSDLQPDWQEAYEERLLVLADVDTTLASAETPEEGLAEWVRRFVMEYDTIPDDLRGLEQLVDKIRPDIASGLADANRMYAIHASRGPLEQMSSYRNDHGEAAPVLDQMKEGAYKWAQRIVGSSVGALRIKRKVYKALMDIEGNAKEGHEYARNFMHDIEGSDLDMFMLGHGRQNTMREVALALGGSKGENEGIRIAAPNPPKSERKNGGLTKGLAKVSFIESVFGELDQEAQDEIEGKLTAAGFTLPEDVDEGGYFWLTNETLAAIKQEVGHDSWNEFQEYAQFKAALERYETDGHLYPGVREELPPAALAEILQEMEDKNPQFHDGLKRVQEFMDQLLLVPLAAGEFTVDQVVNIKEKWNDYVPLPRQVERRTNALKAHAREARSAWSPTEPSAGVHRAHGSELAFSNLEEAIQGRVQAALSAFNSNRMMWGMDRLATRLSNDKNLPLETRKLLRQMMVPIGMEPHVVANLSDSEQEQIVIDYMNSNEDFPPPDGKDKWTASDLEFAFSGMPVWRLRAPHAPMIMAMSRGGKRHYRQVTDPIMFEMLAGMSKPNEFVRFVSEMMANALQPWKNVITQNLVFPVRNMPRDTVNAVMNSRDTEGYVPAIYAARALMNRFKVLTGKGNKDVFLQADLYGKALDHTTSDAHQNWFRRIRAQLFEGITDLPTGVERGLFDKDATWTDRAKIAPMRLFASILFPVNAFNVLSGGRWTSQSLESSNREGAMLTALAKGKTMQEAVYDFDRITGNFGQRGTGGNIATIIRSAGFFNPALQVMWQLGEHILDPDPKMRMFRSYLKYPVLVGFSALASWTSLTLLFASLDDDEAEEMKEWLSNRTDKDKFSFMNVHVPYVAPFGFRLPFEYGLAGAAQSTGWNLVEHAMVESELKPMEFLKQAGERFWEGLPGMGDAVNPYVKSMFGLSINKDFYYDQQIVPDWLEKEYPNTPEAQHFLNTHDVYKDVSKALPVKVSPLKLQFAVNALFTRQMDDFIRTSHEVLHDKRGFHEIFLRDDPNEVPMIGRLFTSEPRGWRSAPVKTAEAASVTFKELRHRMRTLITQSPGDPEIGKIAKQLSQLAGYHSVMNTVRGLFRQAKRLKAQGNLVESKQMEREMTRVARQFIKKHGAPEL